MSPFRRPRKQPELWGATRVGQELGMPRPNVYRLLEEGKMPNPAPAGPDGSFVMEPRGTVWYAEEIREFAAKRAA